MQNQDSSSWNDDPFELKGRFKGVTRLSHSRNLYLYAEEIVSNHAKFDGEFYVVEFASLPEYEQNELCRLYLEFTDRETSECIHGNDFSIDNNFTCALLNMLQNDCIQTRELFAETTRKNIIEHYEHSIQKLLNEACEDFLQSQYSEAGYYSQQCRDTGEVIWSKA